MNEDQITRREFLRIVTALGGTAVAAPRWGPPGPHHGGPPQRISESASQRDEDV